jgi:HD-like signal output (HDOD) protein
MPRLAPLSGGVGDLSPALIIPAPANKNDSAAHLFLIDLAEELSGGALNLPCFPDTVPRVRQVLNDPNCSADDVVTVVAAEPRLSARLIQTANSVVFNPSGQKNSDLRLAVTRLGQDLVQSIAMAFAFQQMKADESLQNVAEPLSRLWERSLAVGSICKVLAKKMRVPSEKVFLTGLLHGIGLFYVTVRAAQPNHSWQLNRLLSPYAIQCHPFIGRAVMAKWGFEAVICEAIGNQRNYTRRSQGKADMTDVLVASVLLAEALLERNGDLDRCTRASAFTALQLTSHDLTAVLKHTALSLQSIRDTLGC